jgi:hypothetical protein
VPLVAYLATASTRAELGSLLRRRTPYLVVAAAAVAMAITTPAVVFDVTAVRDGLLYQMELYARVRPNERSASLAFNTQALIDGIGVVPALLGAAGCLAIIIGRRRRDLMIPVFVVAYFVVISIPATHFERNLLPIVPYLAVAAGLLIADGIDRVAGKADPTRAARHGPFRGAWIAIAVAAAILVIGLAPGFARAYQEGRQLEGTDTRTLAREWLLANVPRKSIVAREQYTPQITPDEYRLRNHEFLWQRDWAWYEELDVRYLITSSLVYARFHDNPDAPAQDAFYTELFALPEVFRADPGPDTPGPTIRIFELPPRASSTPGTSDASGGPDPSSR